MLEIISIISGVIGIASLVLAVSVIRKASNLSGQKTGGVTSQANPRKPR